MLNLQTFIDQNDMAGWDPYDGLNSGFVKFWTFNSPKLRLWAQQFMKRSAVNLRPLLGVVKGRNPKGMGLLAKTYIHLYKQTQKEGYRKKALDILSWLTENNGNVDKRYHGICWGYNFDWQSAVFYIPKGEPTVVNTCFIASAFLDGYEVFGEKKYLDIARSACDFILNDLHRTHKRDVRDKDADVSSQIRNSQSEIPNAELPFCFSYSPFDRSITHNANLLAAELLVRVNKITQEPELLTNAARAVDFTLYMFNKDGSIYQGTAPEQKFIDSFHTGFVLTSLWSIAELSDLEEKNAQYMRIMYNAYNYYRQAFFDKSGRPHYYYNNMYPIDLHCTAQGIVTFLKFKGHDPQALDRAKTLAQWAIDNMWDRENGYFWYQKGKYVTNKIPYLRWPNVWMFYALSLLQYADIVNT